MGRVPEDRSNSFVTAIAFSSSDEIYCPLWPNCSSSFRIVDWPWCLSRFHQDYRSADLRYLIRLAAKGTSFAAGLLIGSTLMDSTSSSDSGPCYWCCSSVGCSHSCSTKCSCGTWGCSKTFRCCFLARWSLVGFGCWPCRQGCSSCGWVSPCLLCRAH